MGAISYLPCGHKSTYRDKHGSVHCRECRQFAATNKKFFRLLEQYMQGDESVLPELLALQARS